MAFSESFVFISTYKRLKTKDNKMDNTQALQDIANKLRIDCIEFTNATGSGHPTSCASVAEIMSVLFFHTMRYKVLAPKDPYADRFILSKGHTNPILYAVWAEAGLFPVEDLMTLHNLKFDLERHPLPLLNFGDVATGFMEQGLAVATGMAYVGKYLDKAPYRVYCLVSDCEASEGSIWASLHFASYYKLDNLVVIFDVNRLGQSEPNLLQHEVILYDARIKSFGLHSLVVNGHDVPELVKAFDEAATVSGKPTALVAKTFKGKGCSGILDQEDWHGQVLGAEGEQIIKHLEALISDYTIHLNPLPPALEAPKTYSRYISLSSYPSYYFREEVSTILAYGNAVKKIANTNSRVIFLDGEPTNSTYSHKFRNAYPERYVECFVAAQNMVGVAIGAASRDRSVVFASTFAAFFTRAFDQIRMGAISKSNINLVGSHCGLSSGEDGPSQMGLEDLALFRAIPTATIFYPSDAVSMENAVEQAANTKGICYIRASQINKPVIFPNRTPFMVGRARILVETIIDEVLLIGAGVTLFEVLRAAKDLHEEGIGARVMDPYTIKPLDVNSVRENALACAGNVIVVEDHYQAGGLGEAVLSALAMTDDVIVKHMYVAEVPRSGPPAELLDMYGISARHIVAAAVFMVRRL